MTSGPDGCTGGDVGRATHRPFGQERPRGNAERVALVTGATGFIGWNLCERLIAQGWAVRAAVRRSSRNPLPAGVARFDAELAAGAMAPACEMATVVFHLAGLTRAVSYEQFCAVNEEGARQAAVAARDAEAAFVLVSSLAAAGPGIPARPRRETDAPAPVSLYGRSKLAGERAVERVDGLRWTVARPPAVYGPHDKDFLALFQAGKRGLVPLLGDPNTAYTFVHVDDVTAALVAIAESVLANGPALHQKFFLGHPDPVTQGQLAELISGALDRSRGPDGQVRSPRTIRQIPVPRAVLWTLAQLGELQGRLLGTPGLVNRSRYRELTAPGFVCSVDKLAAEIGMTAEIEARRGFELTAAWYRNAGSL